MFKRTFDFHDFLRTEERSRVIGGLLEDKACNLEKADLTLNLFEFHHQTNALESETEGLTIDEMH